LATARKKTGSKKASTKKVSSGAREGKTTEAKKPKAAEPKASAKKAAVKKAPAKKAAVKKAPTKKASGRSAAAAKSEASAKLEAFARTRSTQTRVAKAAEPVDRASKKVALAVAEAALDKKALNVEIIDVADKVDYADYVVVMSGTSDRQVNALARGISEDVQQKTGSRCMGVEGLPGGAWVLMDFGDVVVHIFHHDVRGYYDIESLWLDATRVVVPGGAPA
jgi:ribosome-associated protein